jgi:hypothetical protein
MLTGTSTTIYLILVPTKTLAFARVYAGLFLTKDDDTCIPAKLTGVCV